MTRILDAIYRASIEDLVWLCAFSFAVEFLIVAGCCSCATSTATLLEPGCVEVSSAHDAGRP